MQSHFVLLVVFAFFVSLVFAVIAKGDRREQLKLGGLMWSGFVGVAVILGWLMYFLPF